jgi:hypothetical protein
MLNDSIATIENVIFTFNFMTDDVKTFKLETQPLTLR